VLAPEHSRDVEEKLITVFSKTSAIGLAIFDNQRRFRFVNDAVVTMHNGIPAEAFVSSTIRDIIGDAASGPEARQQRVFLAGEAPPIEVTVMLPSRTEIGYWIEKNFAIKGRSGRITQVVSLAVEVTGNRKLEKYFQKLSGELLWKNKRHQQLAQELHDAISQYHVALRISLDRLSRCSTDPERIPELLADSAHSVDERMQKLRLVVAKCFPIHGQ
jgi:signal transduction histidine kinase